MKKIKFILGFILISSYSLAQPPTGTGGNSKDWHRGGNLNAPPGQGGVDNIFGTMWNSPIYTYTNGVGRTRLNGSLITTINAIPGQDVSGYFGIAPNAYFNTNVPRSMMHLQGNNNSGSNDGGWRTWMRTGIFISENSDEEEF